MPQHRRPLWQSRHALGVLGAVALAAALPTLAQEGDTGFDTSREPRPALIAPKAASSLLLSLARAGEHWVAVGQYGNILRSTDGQHWEQVPAPNNATLTRVRFVDAHRGYAIGYDGTVLASRDGGASWALQQHDPAWGKPFYDLLWIDAEHGLLAGANGTLKRSTDGGDTWEDIDSDALADGPNLYRVLRVDDQLLLTGERGFLARSSDGGDTWERLKSPYTGSFFGAINVDAGVVIFGLRGNAFYAPKLSDTPALTQAEIDAMWEAAFDPAHTGAADPVSDVAGWAALHSDAFESLFDATRTDDGDLLLFGTNGHVMQADLAQATLRRLDVGSDININDGAIEGDALIVVGTSGVTRLRRPNE